MDGNTSKLLGLDKYTRALSRILRELLPAGSRRDWDKISELAQELEQVANDGRGGKFEVEGDGNP